MEPQNKILNHPLNLLTNYFVIIWRHCVLFSDSTESQEPIIAEEDDTPVQPKEMTLDEYKEQERKNRMKSDFNIRKPGEGVDNNQWKTGFALEKKKKDVSDDDDDEDDEVRKSTMQCYVTIY